MKRDLYSWKNDGDVQQQRIQMPCEETVKLQQAWVAIFMTTCLACSGAVPGNLGMNNGIFASCPDTPNCVSTQSQDDKHRIAPIRYTTSLEVSRLKLRNLLQSMKRTRIVSETETYIHAECRSLLFRFVDDLQCYFDDSAKTIHLRSAARLGSYDFGVNRRRTEEIRKRFSSE